MSTTTLHVFLCNIGDADLAPLPCKVCWTPGGATQDNPPTDYRTRHAIRQDGRNPLPRLDDSPFTQISREGDQLTARPRNEGWRAVAAPLVAPLLWPSPCASVGHKPLGQAEEVGQRASPGCQASQAFADCPDINVTQPKTWRTPPWQTFIRTTPNGWELRMPADARAFPVSGDSIGPDDEGVRRPVESAYADADMAQACRNCGSPPRDWCRRRDGRIRFAPCLSRRATTGPGTCSR